MMQLKFDEMAVDTSLAQTFLKTLGIGDDCDFKNNELYDGKNYYKSAETFKENAKEVDVNCQQMIKLVEKLKDNSELFAQLEYMSRLVPIEDSKVQINLMIRQIQYVSSIYTTDVSCKYGRCLGVTMSNDEPLLSLGYIAKVILVSSKYFCLCTGEVLAPTCILFTQLCCEIGLPVFTMFESDLLSRGISTGTHLQMATVGVITENSDVDSAVDLLLSVSPKAPWKLELIFVQESVSQQFKQALAWKCKVNEISETLRYSERVIHLDQLRINESTNSDIYIDSYRTTKELLSLLNEYPLYYLSLWANNIAEINEIAYSVQTPILWVNGVADFNGPPRITEAMYPYAKETIILPKDQKLVELSKLSLSWLKLTVQSRRDIVCKVIAGSDRNVIKLPSVDSLTYPTANSFVYSGKDYVCSSVPTASSKFLYAANALTALTSSDFFESIILGSACAINSDMTLEIIKIVDKFRQANVPIVPIAKSDGNPTDENQKAVCDLFSSENNISFWTRIIWTNSGTTFAN